MLSARSAEGDAEPGYERHRPEQTLLYQIIEQHYPDFLSAMEAQDRPLPGYVQDEFDAFLQCGRLERGFLRVRCEECKHEHLVAFSWPLLRAPKEVPLGCILAPAALVTPFTSQTPRLLPQLWRPADGRKCCSVGGRCIFS